MTSRVQTPNIESWDSLIGMSTGKPAGTTTPTRIREPAGLTFRGYL